ncbi:SDR family NAD(P)-dependent oxidoreductase [Nocardia sp. NPDC051052]|uniref:SDR family NAD(P)-dependent oxidoreductase n=1 Tax=Nocardia sp. NPDC051052 TaxID=3364322 RepID=UPI0037B30CFD
MGSNDIDVTGKRIVITGATNGIGKEIARALARRGASLTLVARNETKAAATADELQREPGAQGRPDIISGDLSDLASVRRAGERIRTRYAGIDVLINNAGIHALFARTTVDGFESMTATNHLGPFLLTNLLLDQLIAAAPSRIVVTASEAHRNGGRPDLAHLGEPRGFGPIGSFRAYGQSKLMNILFTQELARRLDGSGVTVNCFCPGANATGLISDDRLLAVPMKALARTRIIRRPEVGARTGIDLSIDPKLESTTGQFITSTPGLHLLPPVAIRRDTDYQHSLWLRSAELVGL